MNDNDKIALSLLAIASMVIWKKRKTDKIGATKRKPISRERRKCINDIYKGLKRHFDRLYRAEEVQATTDTKYYKFKDGDISVKIRRGTHRSRNGNKPILLEADLYSLTKQGEPAMQIYNRTKNIIETTIKAQQKMPLYRGYA